MPIAMVQMIHAVIAEAVWLYQLPSWLRACAGATGQQMRDQCKLENCPRRQVSADMDKMRKSLEDLEEYKGIQIAWSITLIALNSVAMK